MRVVFLDFDGVLNSRMFILACPSSERCGVMGLDTAAVGRLNRLLSETGAEVVVSSTWRLDSSLDDLRAVLSAAGMVGTVRGKTPELPRPMTRGDEVLAWLEHAPLFGIDVDAFVILDDDDDLSPLTANLVRTSFEEGLLDRHVEAAVEVLGRPPRGLVTAEAADIERYADKSSR